MLGELKVCRTTQPFPLSVLAFVSEVLGEVRLNLRIFISVLFFLFFLFRWFHSLPSKQPQFQRGLASFWTQSSLGSSCESSAATFTLAAAMPFMMIIAKIGFSSGLAIYVARGLRSGTVELRWPDSCELIRANRLIRANHLNPFFWGANHL